MIGATQHGPTTVAVVEDDQSVREMLCAVLAAEGHAVSSSADGETALADEQTRDADLVILDIGLPAMSGLDVCSQLRESGRTDPVLILTARHDVPDRVAGLDAGADDYLVKPFSLDELLARVRALLRRSRRGDPGLSGDVVALDDLTVDTITREARRGGELLELTRIEFDLLTMLVTNSPAVMTREDIHEHVWGWEQDHMSNSLEVFVSQLRRKMEAGGRERLIQTVRGVGYAARRAPRRTPP